MRSMTTMPIQISAVQPLAAATSLSALPHAARVVVPACLLARIILARPLARGMRSARDLPRAVPVVVAALLCRDGDDAQQLGLHVDKQHA